MHRSVSTLQQPSASTWHWRLLCLVFVTGFVWCVGNSHAAPRAPAGDGWQERPYVAGELSAVELEVLHDLGSQSVCQRLCHSQALQLDSLAADVGDALAERTSMAGVPSSPLELPVLRRQGWTQAHVPPLLRPPA